MRQPFIVRFFSVPIIQKKMIKTKTKNKSLKTVTIYKIDNLFCLWNAPRMVVFHNQMDHFVILGTVHIIRLFITFSIIGCQYITKKKKIFYSNPIFRIYLFYFWNTWLNRGKVFDDSYSTEVNVRMLCYGLSRTLYSFDDLSVIYFKQFSNLSRD